jgi:K+-transporting ATPase ATPase A chain
MNTELFGVISIFIISIILAVPVGKYIAKVLREIKHSWPDFQSNWEIYFQNKWYQFHWRNELETAFKKSVVKREYVWFFFAFFVLLFQVQCL